MAWNSNKGWFPQGNLGWGKGKANPYTQAQGYGHNKGNWWDMNWNQGGESTHIKGKVVLVREANLEALLPE